MELGTFGLDMPTFIFMIMSFLALLQMSPSLICLSRTVACQAHTSLRRQLWKSYRTVSPTITRYVGCISLWWTCGGHGKYNTARAREITDQLWLIRDCDDTRRVSPFRPDGPEPPEVPSICKGLCFGWLRVIWCGRKGSRMFSWILLG